jgi:hypothetical protein
LPFSIIGPAFFCFTILTILALTIEIAAVCSLYATFSSIGAFTGDIIASNLWSSILQSRLITYLPATERGNATLIRNSVIVAKSYARGTLERDAIDRSYAEAMRALQIAGIIAFAIGGLVVSFGMRNLALDEHVGRQEEEEEEEEDDSWASDRHERTSLLS